MDDNINIASPLNDELVKLYRMLERKGIQKVKQEIARNYYPRKQAQYVKLWLQRQYREKTHHIERRKLNDVIRSSELTALFWTILLISLFIFDHVFNIFKFLHIGA